ncbi:MAG TPA: hypothetical protein PLB12_10775 [Candidatus Goldiibacteriota bacterium]|nr:hypothetical protein [Candidatus Goldiibacteriota bacterium]
MEDKELKRQLELVESIFADNTKKASEIIKADDSILLQLRLTPLDITKSEEMKKIIKDAGGKTIKELDKDEENRVNAEASLSDQAIEDDRRQEEEHLGNDFDEKC